MSKKSIRAGWKAFALKNARLSSKSVFSFQNLRITVFARNRSLESTLKQKKTKDMNRAQRLFDEEVQSVASREYDPSKLDLRGNRFRSSY